MIAIAGAIVFFLQAFGAIDSTSDVNWTLVAAGLWALHFGVDAPLPVGWRVWDRNRGRTS